VLMIGYVIQADHKSFGMKSIILIALLFTGNTLNHTIY
jgi:hypothetical protein